MKYAINYILAGMALVFVFASLLGMSPLLAAGTALVGCIIKGLYDLYPLRPTKDYIIKVTLRDIGYNAIGISIVLTMLLAKLAQ